MHEIVKVDLKDRSYDIHIGQGLIHQFGDFLSPYLGRERIAVITDQNVANLHLDKFKQSCKKSNIKFDCLILPAGEATKSWKNLQKTVEWLLSLNIERDDLIVAFGGGVIGDLVGFCAAILRRGVRFVQIPTTLLAQVDSSVGGKTAINSAHGKNLIGAFYQPQLVLADVDLLETLTKRDFLAGYGEVSKYGLLGDEKFFVWLEKNGADLAAGDVEKRIYAVKRSCQMKADIVSEDETEQGVRALLNLGHTFCHALEAATGYSDRLLHGEGVSIGCALAFETSMRLGFCAQEVPSRVREHFRMMEQKFELADIKGSLPNADRLLELMGQDKKVKAGKIAFILAKGIGNSFISRDVDIAVVRSVLVDALAQR